MSSLSLREAIRRAEELGIAVEAVHRTGEVVFRFPERNERVNARRKDAPKRLQMRLRRAEEGA